MSLQIDGVTVQSWDNVSTNNSTYSFFASEGVSADRIRVAFTNDLFDEANGIDRNLIVDSVNVDGQVIQIESSQVFSTGTWLPGDGVTPGFGRGETLHTDGYFQLDGGGAVGSEIFIIAQGSEGDEIFELLIDGQTVQQFQPIGTGLQQFTYTASDQVSADQVRIAFTNDSYDPANNFDRNLRVQRIRIDDTSYVTDSPSVFSTGTWNSADGITPGFGRGDVLNGNGYFQYASGPAGDDGSFLLSDSVINVNEADGVATLTILRSGGSSTPASLEYRTVSGTAQDGQDYTGVDSTIVFQPGETSRDINIPIIVDSNGEGSESFSFTIDNPSGAGLLVPRTATITINDIALPSYDNFDSIAGLDLNGTAQRIGSRLRLTTTSQDTAGSVFYESALPINSDTSLQSQFSFNLNGGNGSGGADGLAFVVQGSNAGSAALGPSGGQLGYEGITNSLAIEFDTYQNAGDVNANHVSVLVNGSTTTPIATKTADFDLNNGSTKYAWVEYNGTNNLLAVYLSENNAKPSSPLITTTVDLQTLVGNNAYVGFTSGVGGLQNNHDVLSWAVNTEVPPIPNDPSPGGTLISQSVATGLNKPTSIDFTADGTNMYVAEQRGIVHVYQNGVDQGTLLDFTDRVNGTRDRGLLDIAVHPDLANNPYLYLLYTYDPPQVNSQSPGSLAGADGNGNRAGRLTRVTLDASTGYTSIVDGSEVILLGENSTWDNFNAFANSTSNFNEPPAGILADGSNLQDFIATDSESHTVGSVEFGPDGALYVSIGDGTSYNQVDVRTLRVQDIDNLSGKILRIDPITGDGLSDNPFFNGNADANRSKVYQYGVRNPFRITVDDATGQVYVGDVGWTRWEEINAAGPGANFGWPFYEGASGANAQTNQYRNLPEAADFYANNNATPSILALNHAADGINAIVLGDIYDGNQYPAEYQGDLFFNDLGQGIVRNISLDSNGDIAGVQTFTTGAQVVVQMVQSPDGFMYFVDLDDGLVGRWEFV
jgi:glucose/arabinose dehydrogenase